MASLEIECKVKYTVWYYIALASIKLKLHNFTLWFIVNKPLAKIKIGNRKYEYIKCKIDESR